MPNRPWRRPATKAAAQAALREGGAAGGLGGVIDALAGAGEQHGVVADDVAAAHGGEADRRRIALAGHAFAGIDGAVLQVAAPGGGAPRAICSAVPLGHRPLAVVGLDDLDVVAGRSARGPSPAASGHVDAHAHVGRHHDGDVPWRRRAISAFCASVKPVVPMTMPSRPVRRKGQVHGGYRPGRVKSISTCGRQAGVQVDVMTTPWPARNALASGHAPGWRRCRGAGRPVVRAPARPRSACGPCGPRRRPRRCAAGHGPRPRDVGPGGCGPAWPRPGSARLRWPPAADTGWPIGLGGAAFVGSPVPGAGHRRLLVAPAAAAFSRGLEGRRGDELALGSSARRPTSPAVAVERAPASWARRPGADGEDIVPAVGVEHVGEQRRAQHVAHLGASCLA